MLRNTLVIFLCLLLVACGQKQHTIPGYIEANLTYLGSPENGILTSLKVSRGMEVVAGTPLFSIDTPQDYYVKAAQATLRGNEAQAKYQIATLARYQNLYQQGVISKQEYDNYKTQYSQSKADLAATQNNLAAYQWHNAKTTIVAPAAGKIFDTYYWVGETVASNQPVVSLLVPGQVKLVFFVAEPSLTKMQLGGQVYFKVDGDNALTSAHITYISAEAEYTPPVIYSDEMRADLVYRIEAAIDNINTTKWHPGQAVSVILP